MERSIAKNLLKRGAVKFSPNDPFVWSSGIKSPIYCDNRLMISFVEERNLVVEGFVKKIRELEVMPDVIGGTATAAIPWAAFVAYEMNLPMIYIRPQKKMHGRAQQIEGDLEKGCKVLILEDLVSTGGSSIEAANIVREEGECEVTDVFAIMEYGLPGSEERFEGAGLGLTTLTSYDVVADVALGEGYIDSDQLALVKKFRANPEDWSV